MVPAAVTTLRCRGTTSTLATNWSVSSRSTRNVSPGASGRRIPTSCSPRVKNVSRSPGRTLSSACRAASSVRISARSASESSSRRKICSSVSFRLTSTLISERPALAASRAAAMADSPWRAASKAVTAKWATSVRCARPAETWIPTPTTAAQHSSCSPRSGTMLPRALERGGVFTTKRPPDQSVT